MCCRMRSAPPSSFKQDVLPRRLSHRCYLSQPAAAAAAASGCPSCCRNSVGRRVCPLQRSIKAGGANARRMKKGEEGRKEVLIENARVERGERGGRAVLSAPVDLMSARANYFPPFSVCIMPYEPSVRRPSVGAVFIESAAGIEKRRDH